MSDTVYNVKKYMSIQGQELVNLVVTGFFASFILSFTKWGDDTFELYAGLEAWLLTFLFLMFFMIVTVMVCKLVAIRLGYLIHYKPHLIGLFGGLLVTVASNGLLPLFLPGGFVFNRPERLAIGKFKSQYKGWEMGLVASTFPLVILVFILLISPLYLLTGSEFYVHLITVVCLTAIYAIIPVPNLKTGHKGNLTEWYKYLRGCTFGLDVFYASGPGYLFLITTVIVFSLLAWLLTASGSRVGIFIYVVAFLIAVLGWWIYIKFFEKS